MVSLMSRVLLAGLVVLLGAAPTFAAPITYVVTTMGNGSLNGTAFTNALVTISLFGDTTGVVGGPSVFENSGTATVSVAGVGSDTFAVATEAFVNQGFDPAFGVTGIRTTANVPILLSFDAAFKTYNLTTAIGPIGPVPVFTAPGFPAFATLSGSFSLLVAAPFSSTFTATLEPRPVPEPAVLALLAAGVTLHHATRRRRKSAPQG
jgi:hypothetical protein